MLKGVKVRLYTFEASVWKTATFSALFMLRLFSFFLRKRAIMSGRFPPLFHLLFTVLFLYAFTQDHVCYGTEAGVSESVVREATSSLCGLLPTKVPESVCRSVSYSTKHITGAPFNG